MSDFRDPMKLLHEWRHEFAQVEAFARQLHPQLALPEVLAVDTMPELEVWAAACVAMLRRIPLQLVWHGTSMDNVRSIAQVTAIAEMCGRTVRLDVVPGRCSTFISFELVEVPA